MNITENGRVIARQKIFLYLRKCRNSIAIYWGLMMSEDKTLIVPNRSVSLVEDINRLDQEIIGFYCLLFLRDGEQFSEVASGINGLLRAKILTLSRIMKQDRVWELLEELRHLAENAPPGSYYYSGHQPRKAHYSEQKAVFVRQVESLIIGLNNETKLLGLDFGERRLPAGERVRL